MALVGHTPSDEHPHPSSKSAGISEKQEEFLKASVLKASVLKASLLEKISEKSTPAESGLTEEGGHGPEEVRERSSPSPISTISSSGEVGGVYMLYSDISNSEDEEEEASGMLCPWRCIESGSSVMGLD